MLARLQHLDPSERRDLLSQRSGFAEKQHNLALGSQEWTITVLQMVIEIKYPAAHPEIKFNLSIYSSTVRFKIQTYRKLNQET